jgi:hypothetical protein
MSSALYTIGCVNTLRPSCTSIPVLRVAARCAWTLARSATSETRRASFSTRRSYSPLASAVPHTKTRTVCLP